MVFDRGVRDQEERVDAVEGMFQRSSVVVVCFADGCTGQTLFLQLFGRAGDECKVLCWKAIQDVLTVPPPIPPEAGKIPTVRCDIA